MKNVRFQLSSKWLAGGALSVAVCLAPPLSVAVLANKGVNTTQQDGTVHAQGVVVDGTGQTVIGATVRVVGSQTATVSDIDGNFQLDVPAGTTLQISSIGYNTQKIKVPMGGRMRITLTDNATTLKDVQVVAYGTQKKVTVTGAISSIKGSELLKTPTGSITNMLAGAVPASPLSNIQVSPALMLQPCWYVVRQPGQTLHL